MVSQPRRELHAILTETATSLGTHRALFTPEVVMILGRFVAVATLLALTVGPLAAQRVAATSEVEMRLQAAMHKEQVEGRLPEAIEAYKAIVAQAGSGQKNVAARALLQMARSYEKLGQPQARDTYQKIVRDYADQPAVVAAARAKLNVGTSSGPQEITPRRILDRGWATLLDISDDGRLAVGVERSGFSAQSVMLRDVTSGRTTTLVSGSLSGSAGQSRISRDGRRVAYTWSEMVAGNRSGGNGLRVIGTEPGSSPQVIVSLPQADVTPADWSPDGKAILAVITSYRDPAMTQVASYELAWVIVGDKSIRRIKLFESWQRPPYIARVSPDGSLVTFSAPPRQGSADRYVYVITSDGQRESAIVTTAGTRDALVWTPDGSRVLFTGSDVRGSALWSVGLQNGQAAGESVIVQSDFTGRPIGMTKSGVLYFSRAVAGGNYEYIVPRSLQSADRPLTFPGLSGAWSPDGRFVALVRESGPPAGVVIRNIETGEERSYQRAGITLISPRWLHDGSGVIVVATDEVAGRSTQAFFVVDFKTGEFRKLFDRDASGRTRTGVGVLSRDDKKIYVGVRNAVNGPVSGIVSVDLATGAETPVMTFDTADLSTDPLQPGLALSPDGTTLAVMAPTKTASEARIFTVGVDGSNYRTIVSSFRSGATADRMTWTADGQTIVFIGADANYNWRVMRVPAAGGEPQFDGLSYDSLAPLLPGLRMWPGNFNNLDLSPDGSRALVSTLTFATQELWTIDNLLSFLNARR